MSSSDSDDVAIDALWDPDRLVVQSEEQVQTQVGHFEFRIEQHLELRKTGQPDREAGTTEQESTTGAVLWDGAVVAARFVYQNALTLLPTQGQCIELGCGVGGLTGLTLGKLGNPVVLTDMKPVLGPCLLNLKANLTEVEMLRVEVCELVWGEEFGDELCSTLTNAQLKLVVSSDTVYDPCLVKPLLHTIHRLLATSNDAAAVVTYDTSIGRSTAYAEWERCVGTYFEHVEVVSPTDPRRAYDNGLEDKESVVVYILHSTRTLHE